MEQFRNGSTMETSKEHIEGIKRMIEEAGIAEGSTVKVITRDHPNGVVGMIRSMQLEESEPGFLADAPPMKNVRFNLKSIFSIEKEESPR